MKENKSIATIILLVVLVIISCTSVDTDYPFEEVCLQNNTLQPKDECDNQTLARSRKQTELDFSKSVNGIPLVIPLIEESSPSLFLMPVATDSSMCIQKLYIVDSTQKFRFGFNYDRDVFSVDSVYYFIDEEEPWIVVASGKDGTPKRFSIDGFTYRDIVLINQNKYNKFPSNLVIPIIKIPKVPKEMEQ